MTTTSERGFPWILTVLSAALLAVLIGLGVWQVQRQGRHQRQPDDQMQPHGRAVGDFNIQGRKADQGAGDLHDEAGRPVAGGHRSQVVAADLADRPYLQKTLEQGTLAAVGTPAKQTRPDRVDPGGR